MSRNIRGRLERLERRHPAPGPDALPPDFWPALWGAIPLEQADPETRRILEPMMGRRSDVPDLIEEKIRLASVPLLLPCALRELSTYGAANGRQDGQNK